MLYFEMPKKSEWDPATEQVSNGIESCDLMEARVTTLQSPLGSPATVADSNTSGGQASLADTEELSTSTNICETLVDKDGGSTVQVCVCVCVCWSCPAEK